MSPIIITVVLEDVGVLMVCLAWLSLSAVWHSCGSCVRRSVGHQWANTRGISSQSFRHGLNNSVM